MRFSTFSVSVLPDIETARHNHNLDGLSDKDVGNVLFHQRKQLTGDSEDLLWHQMTIAAVTCIDCQDGVTSIKSEMIPTCGGFEHDVLNSIKERLAVDTHLVNWGADNFTWPLVTYRAMKNGLVWPDAFDLTPEDLQQSYAMKGDPNQTLDQLAKQFHLPGLKNHNPMTLWDDYLNDRWFEIRDFSLNHALNSFLLALRLYHFNGTLSADEKHAAVRSLGDCIDEVTLHNLYKAFGMPS